MADPTPPKRPAKPRGAGLTNAIGGMLVGVEQQILRGRPQVEERYERRDEASIAAEDGGTLVVGLPERSVSQPPAADERPSQPPGD